MMIPSVHRNGTSCDDLVQPQLVAMVALRKAIEAIGQAAPNSRDFYTQGEHAYATALAEHESRLERLTAIRLEFKELTDAILDQR
jgi:hypothetical protein